MSTKSGGRNGIVCELSDYATVRIHGEVVSGRVKTHGYDGERYLLVHDPRKDVDRTVRPAWDTHDVIETSDVPPSREVSA